MSRSSNSSETRGSARQAPPLDTVAEIETPEHIRFRYQLAGPARRMVAYLIDLTIRGIIVGLVILVLSLSSVLVSDGFSVGATLLLVFAIEWGYYVLCESLWSGRTPGKRSMNLRVLKEGGYPTGFLDIALRNLLRAADFLPMAYSVGLAVMGLDARFRRLGDMVAGTIVVVEDLATHRPWPQSSPRHPPSNSPACPRVRTSAPPTSRPSTCSCAASAP